jgi:hypothetical protein
MVSGASEEFLFEGRLIMKRNGNKNTVSSVENRRFRGQFGTTPEICAILWDMISPHEIMPTGVKCCHLLWALMFMKLYASEHVLCSMANCDEKTFRKWAWMFVSALGDLSTEYVSSVAVFIRIKKLFRYSSLLICIVSFYYFILMSDHFRIPKDFVGESVS